MRNWKATCLLILLLLCYSIYVVVSAQVAVSKNDPTGISIEYPFVHLVHSENILDTGSTAYFRAFDPFLFYKLGRDITHRQYSIADGALGRTGILDVPMYPNAREVKHGADARFAGGHTNSCGSCHSVPFREPGAGQTISSTSSQGRNTPHFFGAGLIEMIAEQIRTQIFAQFDKNGNCLIDKEEIVGEANVKIVSYPGSPPIDFGSFRPDGRGVPQINSAFRIWYLDKDGNVLPLANGVNDTAVASLDFAFQAFGWGRGYHEVDGKSIPLGNDGGTIREFFTTAANVHLGMQTFDPTQTTTATHAVGGLARISLNGAQQFNLGNAPDLGLILTGTGISLDDPDGDGKFNEFTHGDVDAAEFYILHTPPPAFLESSTSLKGKEIFLSIGCGKCHVPDWRIEKQGSLPGLKGDRRLFHFKATQAAPTSATDNVTGQLQPLYSRGDNNEYIPSGESFDVTNLYSDFKHWDIGEKFFEIRFDGSVQKVHRTAPLWGIATTAPYGHAGNFNSLETVILAHAGSAEYSKRNFAQLGEKDRDAILTFLNSLVLYHTEEIPCDIDGDGKICQRMDIAGQNVGFERFDPKFLFATPPCYEHVGDGIFHNGLPRPLQVITNVAEVFGLHYPCRKDSDLDSFPDVIDPAPYKPGIR